jgi:probable HAF family extracellular repeat protein
MSWYTWSGDSIALKAVSPDGGSFTAEACCAFGAAYTWGYLFRPGSGYTVIASVQNTGGGCCGTVSAASLSAGGQAALASVNSYLQYCSCWHTYATRYPSGILGALPGVSGGSASAHDISDDGSVVVGSATTADGSWHAFRWTQAAGMVDLGTFAGDTQSSASAISGDGSIVFGSSSSSSSDTYFRWTALDGMVPVVALPPDSTRVVTAFAAESSTIVGYNVVSTHYIPFRWTPANGLETLPLVPGKSDGRPTAVSADGTRIVGYCSNTTVYGGNGGAFLWTPTAGSIELEPYMRSLVPNFGDIYNYYLVSATAISRDGLHIGGNGGPYFDRRVWIAHLPQPPRCGSADFNCDGDPGTDADIEAFFACIAGNCPAPPCASNADFNGDGDSGTDADIEAFFRVLAGQPC